MKQVIDILKMTNKMTAKADMIDATSLDPHIHVLAAELRDAAYKLRNSATKEKERLIMIGKWENPPEANTLQKMFAEVP